jgi:superfamily II DNA or RNA helicase
MVWVAPSIELVEQAVDCICDLWDRYRGAPDVTTFVNEIPSQSKSLARAHVAVFATAQLAARRTRGIKAFNPRLLVFDEAHHAVARTFSNSINVLKQLNGVQIVGLSATPGRMSEFESQELSDLFSGELITSTALGPKPIDTLVQRGVLSRIDLKAIEVEKQWDAIRVRSVKGRSLSIDELALHAGRFWATVGSIENLPDDSKTLVFGASIAHCFALAGALCVRGIPADVVSHNTPDSRRKQILARFRHGDLKVLINKSILATGYDCPAISDVVLATPIRSASLWEQIVGRVSRGPAVGGTEVGRVWELDDHHSMHKKVMSYARYLGDIWDR